MELVGMTNDRVNDLALPRVVLSRDQCDLAVALGGQLTALPGFFLRDNCRCPSCFCSIAFERKLDPATFRPSEEIAAAEWIEGLGLRVRWRGASRGMASHESVFSEEWLSAHAPGASGRSQVAFPLPTGPLRAPTQVKTWDAVAAPSLVPSESWPAIVNDDRALCRWLERFKRFGLGILHDVAELEQLVSRLAYGCFRTTYYGYIFEVVAKEGASDLGYGTAQLPLHVDLACLRNTPGVQCLHYLNPVSDNDGGTTFIDGFAAALRLAERAPNAAATLQSLAVPYRHKGTEVYGPFDMMAVHRTIQTDARSNELTRIVFSNNKRSDAGASGWSLAQSCSFYRAWHLFYEVAHSDDLVFVPEVRKNDVIVIDNHRILHGRRPPRDPARALARRLRGAYLDWDEIDSRWRGARESGLRRGAPNSSKLPAILQE